MTEMIDDTANWPLGEWGADGQYLGFMELSPCDNLANTCGRDGRTRVGQLYE